MIAEEFGRIPMSPYLTATLARAADYAKAQLHKDVSLEHVLLALAEDPEASIILKSSNIDIGRLTSDVSNYIGRMDERVDTAEAAGGTISVDLKRVLEAAAAAAGQGRRREINGAIVLAAIVGDGKSPSAHILRSQGLTFEEAIRALQKVASPPSKPSGSAPRAGTADDIVASQRERAMTRSNPQPVATASGPAPASEVLSQLPAQQPALSETPKPVPQSIQAPIVVPVAAQPAPATPFPLPVPMPAPSIPSPEQPPATQNTANGGWPGQQPQAAPPQYQIPPQQHSPPQQPALSPAQAPQQQAPQQQVPQQQNRSPFPPVSPAQLRAPPPQQLPPPPLQPAQMPYQGMPHMPPFGFPPQSGLRPAQASQQLPPPHQQPTHQQPPWAASGAPPPQQNYQPQQGYPTPRQVPPYDDAMARLDARRPGGPPQTQTRAPQSSGSVRGAPGVMVQAGQLAENIPRKMRVAIPVIVEARIARADVKALADGLQGDGAVYHHEVTVTKAMSVRLRAPDGGFYIETGSPETQWIENVQGLMSNDYASWRWSVTPRNAGKKRLQLVISARTVGADGLAAETALPDQIVDVKVGINVVKTVKRFSGWIAAAIGGGLLARFGENLFDAARVFLGIGL